MVNPYNPQTIPDDFFSVISSIIKRRGSTIDELYIDTRIDMERLQDLTTFFEGREFLEFDHYSQKFFLHLDIWKYWQNKGFRKKIPQGFRSIWLENSPVRDWYPDQIQPKPGLIYYIGPYKKPYISIYKNEIKPLIKKIGFRCETAIEDPGSDEFLKNKILPSMLNARFVICDLSESNPNVHYELGWLHAFGTPFLAFTSDLRPSDINHLTINRIKFDDKGLLELKNLILSSLEKHEVIKVNSAKRRRLLQN